MCTIMAVHNYLYFVFLGKFYLFFIFSNTCSAIHLHNLVGLLFAFLDAHEGRSGKWVSDSTVNPYVICLIIDNSLVTYNLKRKVYTKQRIHEYITYCVNIFTSNVLFLQLMHVYREQTLDVSTVRLRVMFS